MLGDTARWWSVGPPEGVNQARAKVLLKVRVLGDLSGSSGEQQTGSSPFGRTGLCQPMIPPETPFLVLFSSNSVCSSSPQWLSCSLDRCPRHNIVLLIVHHAEIRSHANLASSNQLGSQGPHCFLLRCLQMRSNRRIESAFKHYTTHDLCEIMLPHAPPKIR